MGRARRPALAPAPPRAPLTCGRVARQRAAPGAAGARELSALAQLFLLVFPPPALSHGRRAGAQPGRDGRAAAPTPGPRAPGSHAGALGAWQAGPAGRQRRRRPRERLPLRTPPAARGGAAWRAPSRLPRLLAALRGLRLPARSPAPGPLPLSLPRPAEPQPGIGRVLAGPRLRGEGLRASGAAPRPHALEPSAGPKQTRAK